MNIRMKTAWFKRRGWFHLPSTTQGFVIVAAAFAFCVNVFWAVDRKSHSVGDTLYGIHPFFVSTFFLLDWVARRTSDESG
jgi:hypothetical protein